MNEEYLMKQPKEVLVMWLNSSEQTRKSLQTRLEKLTGCKNFGSLDSSDACKNCERCSPDMFGKCWNFKFVPLR